MVPLPLGRVLATPGAIKLLREVGEHPFDYLARHATGDWGDLDDQDRRRTNSPWSTAGAQSAPIHRGEVHLGHHRGG